MSELVSSSKPDDYAVSLQIRHPHIDPVEITRTLGLEPQYSWRAGEPRRSLQGQPLEGVYHESFWHAEFRDLDAPGQLAAGESILVQAVVQLRRSQKFLSRLQSDGGTVELSLEVSGAGDVAFSLAPELLSMLARCGISLSLKIQPDARLVERRKAS